MKPPLNVGDCVRVIEGVDAGDEFVITETVLSCGNMLYSGKGKAWYCGDKLELADGDLEIMQKRLTAIEKKILQFDGEIGSLRGNISECLIESGDVEARLLFRLQKLEGQHKDDLQIGDWVQIGCAGHDDNGAIFQVAELYYQGSEAKDFKGRYHWSTNYLRKLSVEEITRRLNS